MSTLYMVDLFANPINTAKIIDVRSGPNAPMNGNIVVRVPDYLSVQNPINVTDLITKKHQALLAFYAGFANAVYDDLVDLLDVNLAAPNVRGKFGLRNIIEIQRTARFQTTMIPLVSTPSQAVITFETFSFSGSDPLSGRTLSTYVEEVSSTSNWTLEVSFNNGANFYTTTDGGFLNIPLLGQGNQFILRLTNVSPSADLRLASWALLY